MGKRWGGWPHYDYSWWDCHEGTITVFKDPKTGVLIRGGGETRGLEIYFEDIIVALANVDTKFIKIGEGVDAPELEKYNPNTIRLYWDDMKAFPLDRDFWVDFIKFIRRTKKNITFCCIGGHGRTGTALAIVASLMGVKMEGRDPVEFIRWNYCKEAVETRSQIDYIEEITGRKIKKKTKPAKTTTTTYYSSAYKGGDKKDDTLGVVESNTFGMNNNDSTKSNSTKGGDSDKEEVEDLVIDGRGDLLPSGMV